MNDFNGMSSAVRKELETIINHEFYERQAKQLKNITFWNKLRDNILLLLNKAPK